MYVSNVTDFVLAKFAGTTTNPNITSISEGLKSRGVEIGLDRPEHLAHYIAQIAHESQNFGYDREIWGPTPAQKRYDTRTDLGNTAARDGDGKKYAGHTAMMITGKHNTKLFRDWCRTFGSPPDFVKHPHLMNTDPWEGLGPVWYWQLHKLNGPASVNSITKVTRIINGGYNGLEDRKRHYIRIALVLLGYSPTDVKGFQKDCGLAQDGIAGDLTKVDLHRMLLGMPAVSFGKSETKKPNNWFISLLLSLLKKGKS